MTFQKKRALFRFSGVPLLLFPLALVLSSCRADHVTINPKDPKSPQYAYRLDELALLQMAADDIQELERNKKYGQIYDNFASDAFKAGTSRRRFLIMANCVETYLGGLQEFERNNIGFSREFPKKGAPKSSRPLDSLRREVQRDRSRITEQLVFVPDGIHFKLNSLYWISPDKQFLQCIADSPRIEASTKPPNETSSGEPKDANKAADLEEGPKPATAASVGSTQQASPSSPASSGSPGAETPSTTRSNPSRNEASPPTTARFARTSATGGTARSVPPPSETMPLRHSTHSTDSDSPTLRGKAPEPSGRAPTPVAVPVDASPTHKETSSPPIPD